MAGLCCLQKVFVCWLFVGCLVANVGGFWLFCSWLGVFLGGFGGYVGEDGCQDCGGDCGGGGFGVPGWVFGDGFLLGHLVCPPVFWVGLCLV